MEGVEERMMQLFRFTKKGKCDVCGKVTQVTQECKECYFSGFEIDKQIETLKRMKEYVERKEKQNEKSK